MRMAVKESGHRLVHDGDGVVVDSYTEFESVRYKASRPWVKVYLDAWAMFKNIKGFSDTTCDVLYQILCLYPDAVRKARVRSDATGTYVPPAVSPTIDDKRFWAATMHTSLPVINNAVNKLLKMGILKRVKRGAYLINPELIGCGTEVDMERLRSISGTFKIDKSGATIEPIFEGGNELDAPTNQEQS